MFLKKDLNKDNQARVMPGDLLVLAARLEEDFVYHPVLEVVTGGEGREREAEEDNESKDNKCGQ